MPKFKKRWLISFVLIVFLLLSSLSAIAVSDLEKKIAEKNLKRYTEEYGVANLKPPTKKKVNRIFKKLATNAEKDAPDLDFKLHIVDTPVLNAVYLGNGHIILFRGLLETVENYNQLAAVLAHEMGHGVNNDIQDTINLIQGFQIGSILIDLAKDGKVNQEKPDFITALSWQLLQKGFSREQEREADEYSVFLIEQTDYNPDGTVGLMKVLKKEQKQTNNSKLLELFSSHPNLNNRIDYLSRITGNLNKANQLYYSPIATGRRLTQGLLQDDIELVYSTYSKIVRKRLSQKEFKEDSQLTKIRKKVAGLREKHRLKYSLEVKNQVEGTARVAISLFRTKSNTQGSVIILGIDLIKGKYGWRVLRGPVVY